MTRSHYQKGPATDHYHNALGPAGVIGFRLLTKTVRFNDAGITSYPGVATDWEIETGAWITDAWVVLKTAFDAGARLTLQTDNNGDGVMSNVHVDDATLLEYTAGDLSQALDGGVSGPLLDARSAFVKAAVGGRLIPARVLADVGFFVQIGITPLTVGEADVYVIVATPAS